MVLTGEISEVAVYNIHNNCSFKVTLNFVNVLFFKKRAFTQNLNKNAHLIFSLLNCTRARPGRFASIKFLCSLYEHSKLGNKSNFRPLWYKYINVDT